jgi:hypothetical protein
MYNQITKVEADALHAKGSVYASTATSRPITSELPGEADAFKSAPIFGS